MTLLCRRIIFAAVTALLAGALQLHAQAHPGQQELEAAYKSLAQKDYDSAIAKFRKGLAAQPGNAGAHKDLAYTLLKTGDDAEARDEFAAAMRVNAKDETAALEFAFLAFETKEPIEARRTFNRLRRSAIKTTRATAEQAFQNIDRPLAEGIARWKEALAKSPNANNVAMFSAHWELAQTAELRDELALAAEQYEICHQLKPQMSELLLALARVWQQMNRAEDARAALLAASRSSQARTAEMAMEQLGPRYPYPYEFLAALKIDPRNVGLRRELGYLYLAMKKEHEAAEQFEELLKIDPKDAPARAQLDALHGTKKQAEIGIALLTPAPAPAAGTEAAVDPKSMGMKSLKLGYTRDAIKFLRQAHDLDPDDADVMLQLGWAYNMAKDDEDAIAWFDRARSTEDVLIAPEANKAFHNLRGDVLPQTTIWTLPMYSSRWNDVFSYGQIKRTMPLPWNAVNRIFSLYVSARFIGDVRSSLPTGGIGGPQNLSESEFIFGAGVSSRVWHHVTAWMEAGEAVKYLPGQRDAARPDYRGGVNFAKGFGKLLGSPNPGLFYETTGDAVYVSRFNRDWLFYSQNRAGRTFNVFGDGSAQLLFNVNYTRDWQGQNWANTVELGPGLKLHLPYMPPGVFVSADYLRGFYTRGDYQPSCLSVAHGPTCRPESRYTDVRIGLWYARTK